MADRGPVAYPALVQALAVICPLDIASDDRAWIEDVRARHDPQHKLVEAHFTLVFPTTGIGAMNLARHVEQIAERTCAIAFRLNCARAVRDSLAPRSHIFLMTDDGEAEIRRLHEALYSGELSSSLRTDIPFHPHVTVAAFETHSEAEALSREIGAIEVRGRLRTLALMSVDDGAIRQERAFPLL